VDGVKDDESGSARTIQVLVVDDHRTFAEALCLVLDSQARIHCDGIVGSVEEALDRLARQPTDVVVMDVALRGLDGIEGTRRIRAAHPQTRVVVLTGHVEAVVLARAVEAGASAFLPKHGPLSDVIDAVLAPPGEGLIIGPRTPLPVIGEALRAPYNLGRVGNGGALTARELEVLDLLAEGLSPAAAAAELGITMHTCRGYIKSVLSKLGVHSQLEAVVMAWHRGLIRPPEPRPPEP